MPNPIINRRVIRRPIAVSAYDADAQTYFDQVPTPFTAARKTIINDLVLGLKADGNWTKLDRLWLLATEAQNQALVSLVNPGSAQLTLVNAPVFTVDQGFTGNGTTSYINTQFTPSTDGVNYTLNSASFGVYSRTDSSIAGEDVGVHDVAGVAYCQLDCKWSEGTCFSRINNGGGPFASFSPADSLALFSSVRPDNANEAIYKRGVSVDTEVAASNALPTIKPYILARNSSGTAGTFSTRQLSIGYFGAGTIDQAALYTRIQDYMTSLGSAV